MSLIEKVKKGIKERRAKGKREKQERKAIDRQARQEAHKEYVESYRKERIAVERANARTRAKHDVQGKGGFGNLKGAALGGAKGGFKLLSNAGKNLLESDQFTMPKVDMDFGFSTGKKKKGKKKTGFELGF